MAFWRYIRAGDRALWKTLSQIYLNPLQTFPSFTSEFRAPEEMPDSDQPAPTQDQQSDATTSNKSPAQEETEKTESQHLGSKSENTEPEVATTHDQSPVTPTTVAILEPSNKIEDVL
ncbi:hypothetical protein V6N12_045389 [Hibiscus sabdariffa]|uniref:Uncharacterized protein n=1 Tax=Hibiscus sabdariffa TaxID=183260 RepID=A0ABR2G2P4_9ROSI